MNQLYKIGRFIIYSGYLLALSLIFLYDSKPQPGQKFDESSLTEYFQEGSFFVIVLILLFNAIKRKYTSDLSIAIGGFFLMAFIREFDSVLDKYVYDGAWQTLAFIVLGLLVYHVYKNYKNLGQLISEYMVSYPCGIMVTGVIVTFAYSRLFGEPIMWETLMEENYMRNVKNAAEESIELLGDSLILFSAVEYSLWAKQKQSL